MKDAFDFAQNLAKRSGSKRTLQALALAQVALPALRTLRDAGLLSDISLGGKGTKSKGRGRRGKNRLKGRTNKNTRLQFRQVKQQAEEMDYRPAAFLSFLALPLGLRAERAYQEMRELPERHDAPNIPSLSIIIPARNEADNLKRLLPSLQALEYPGDMEIIVVDDQSTDATGAIAKGLGARVIRINALPEGWHGKPHASHVGAGAAQGDWLLFTDADTVHAPHSATRAVSFASDHALDGLTLFVKQEPPNPFERAVLMAAFAGLFAGTPDPHYLMNGQYILLRREVYEKSGGFEEVRAEPLEDLAFGHRLHQFGYIVPSLRGENAATVEMYSSPLQMWHGMTRLGADSLKWSGKGALVTAVFTTALFAPLLVLVGVLMRRLNFLWLPVTWLAAALSVIPFARRFGGVRVAFLAPLGAAFVLAAAVFGLAQRAVGKGIEWSGREV